MGKAQVVDRKEPAGEIAWDRRYLEGRAHLLCGAVFLTLLTSSAKYWCDIKQKCLLALDQALQRIDSIAWGQGEPKYGQMRDSRLEVFASSLVKVANNLQSGAEGRDGFNFLCKMQLCCTLQCSIKPCTGFLDIFCH